MAFSTKQALADNAEQLIAHHVRDAISRATIEDVLDSTVLWLARYAPRVVNDTLSGTGSAYQFALSGLEPSWVTGFSYLRRVEYPTGNQARDIIDANAYQLFPDLETATQLHFNDVIPASGTDNIRVTYTVPHTVSDTTSTVPDHEEPAYEWAVAGKACEVEAARTARFTDSTLDADAVNYGGASNEWRELAQMFLKQAGQMLGVDLTAAPGAGQTSAPYATWLEYDPQTRMGGHLLRNKTER